MLVDDREPDVVPQGTADAVPQGTAKRTREETIERILDSAEELFAAGSPADVTVREIAEHAGVTHALIHQYFGSKDDLFNAVVQRAAPNRQAVIHEASDIREVIAVLVPDVLDRKLHGLTMLRSSMDGVEYVSLQERIETLGMLVDLAQRNLEEGMRAQERCSGMDPRIVMACVTAYAYGWLALEAWLPQIADLQDEDPEWVRAEIVKMSGCMIDAIFPADSAE